MEETVKDDNIANSSPADSMISSPDYVPPVQTDTPAGEPGKDGADGAEKNADAGNAEGKDKNLDDRFDKEPRFIELNARAKADREARIAAEAKLSILTQSPIGENRVSSVPLPEGIKDISLMPADELREWNEDDPVGYANNLQALTLHNVKSNLTNESVRSATIAAIEKNFDDYAKENPDFNDMWDNGVIPKYMEAHPGNNAISAHMTITGAKSTEAKIAAAVAKATKETEERVTKNFQAKRNATVINPQTPTKGTVDDLDAELKDTSQAGGTVSVLAKRLSDMRRASA
jgi:hypothetical protein